MEEERITLRMGPDDVQLMDNYLEEHPELGLRSQFIRTAVREYIKRDARGTSSTSETKESGLFVRFNTVELAMLGNLKEGGLCLNEEEFIRRCVTDVITPKITPDVMRNYFESAQKMTL
jgi:hypothetical protein